MRAELVGNARLVYVATFIDCRIKYNFKMAGRPSINETVIMIMKVIITGPY